MGSVADYFRSLDTRLRDDFNRIRKRIKDRDAKGHANERILSQFLQKYIPHVRVTHNVEVIDSLGATSGEMDVCACNQFQLPDDDALLLAEGVDFVVQVKGTLTGGELERILDNASKLKSLRRSFNQGDEIFAANRRLVDHLISRIPYFVFAFQSSLRLETALSQWQALLADRNVPSTAQPEAIFVLDRGALLRFLPSGEPESLDHLGNPAWFKAEFDNGTLLAFIDTLMRFGGGIRHIHNPLAAYMAESGIQGMRRERVAGNATSGDEVTPLTWDELKRVYATLVRGEWPNPDVAAEASRRAQIVADCAEGKFPAEAFEVRGADGHPVTLDSGLLDEINYYVRHMSGKDPALSPNLRTDVPFQFESKAAGAIEVTFRSDFLADLQGWCQQNWVGFRPKKRGPA